MIGRRSEQGRSVGHSTSAATVVTRLFLPALLLPALLLFLAGCQEGGPPTKTSPQNCLDCHAVALDPPHNLACTSCHRGEEPAESADTAHQGLIARPAHPDHLTASCGPCHRQEVAAVSASSHFTLPRTTNLTRAAFGAEEWLSSYRLTPVAENPESVLDLADDLLRRRCFHCHPASSGEAYAAVQRGTGCAACHLPFGDGRLLSHRFTAPADGRCLACHYGNYVGFDYYGRFEHDFNHEYRTPYLAPGSTPAAPYPPRPYGVEYRQLQPDIHQQAGMACIDCHGGDELMRGGSSPTCQGCHLPGEQPGPPPPRVDTGPSGARHLGVDGRERPIPPASHPAHRRNPESSCQACHAQWAVSDLGRHFLRQDSDDLDDWWALAVQGSREVEELISTNTNFLRAELPVVMSDGLSGEKRPGIWLQGFTSRRWEMVELGRNRQGLISPMRPILDLSLSWLDEEEVVRFDAVPAESAGANKGLRPYTPHTTGPAGLFAEERIAAFLRREEAARQLPPGEGGGP